jgi:putative Holliday junction resolvase
MSRILALDLGLKRTGIAVTDSLQIIATALETVNSDDLMPFLKNYFEKERVEAIVVGLPKRLDNTPTDMTPVVLKFTEQLRAAFPDKKVELIDERFTTTIASQTLIAMGAKKKDRQKKINTDKISATLILQTFLQTR